MSRRKRITLSITAIIALLFCAQISFDPFAPYFNQQRLNELQIELNAAKAKWESQKITDYSVRVNAGAGLAGPCQAEIVVRQGKVIQAAERVDRFNSASGYFPLPDNKLENGLCNYEDYTIDRVFEIIQQNIDGNYRIDATFDPTYGYPSRFSGDPNVRMGIFTVPICDAQLYYTFSYFKRLRPRQ